MAKSASSNRPDRVNEWVKRQLADKGRYWSTEWAVANWITAVEKSCDDFQSRNNRLREFEHESYSPAFMLKLFNQVLNRFTHLEHPEHVSAQDLIDRMQAEVDRLANLMGDTDE
jgi:hypothetical protein